MDTDMGKLSVGRERHSVRAVWVALVRVASFLLNAALIFFNFVICLGMLTLGSWTYRCALEIW